MVVDMVVEFSFADNTPQSRQFRTLADFHCVVFFFFLSYYALHSRSRTLVAPLGIFAYTYPRTIVSLLIEMSDLATSSSGSSRSCSTKVRAHSIPRPVWSSMSSTLSRQVIG